MPRILILWKLKQKVGHEFEVNIDYWMNSRLHNLAYSMKAYQIKQSRNLSNQRNI